jgi:DNA-binding CsgD family transcriptional regulator
VPGAGPVGRESEIAHVDRFLRGADARALAITGPAGIGKTTVWSEGVRLAAEQGSVVLTARPSGAETEFSYVGLGDLLASVDRSHLDALATPQRHAVEVALLRSQVDGPPLDARAVSTGVLSLLRELARAGPLVVAVDDAQWLDAATAEALAFCARRLEELPVRMLVSVRVEADRPDTFERAVPAALRDEVVLGPLSVATLHDIVARELGVALPRPVLVRIATACEGNPFYALELARELVRTGVPALGDRLPVPQEIRALARSRIGRLPRETQDALLAATCLSRPTAALVDVEALAPAEEAGIVQVDARGGIRFSHPLLASAVYESAPAGERRRMHRLLSEQVDDPEERARHLSLVTDRRDEAVAAVVAEAALHARSRGASLAAAELGLRAFELTPDRDSETGVRRALAAAQHLLDTGAAAEAGTLLARVDLEHLPGDLRAELLLAIGRNSWYEQDRERGYTVLLEALDHAHSPALAAAIHVEAAWVVQDVDPLVAIGHTDAVLELVDPDDHPGMYSRALLHGAYLRLVSGQGADYDAYERGVAIQQRTADWQDRSPVWGMWPLLLDDFDTARSLYEPGVAHSRAAGDEHSVQGTLVRLVEIELWTGDWARADELAREGAALAERMESQAYLGSALFASGLVDAHLGRVDEARAAGERIVELFPTGEPQRPLGHWVLGFLALSLEDPAGAEKELTQAAAAVAALGLREPARFRFDGDLVEAVIALGDLDRAASLIDDLERRGRILPRPWTLATAARCRGLLQSALGDLDAARASTEEALDHHARLQMPFERARTLLVFGQLLRRRKERREARAAISEALAALEELGAQLWADRARAELARVPARRAPSELTATEQAIASLAATGLTNRAIAERIYVSPKTVESNLARVYRKLGIGSRAELGRAMAERERPEAARSSGGE